MLIALGLLGACQSKCGRDEPGCNEMQNKAEYSVLQAIEYDLREKPHDRAYYIVRDALESELTVIAFPTLNSDRGYVTLLANSKVPPRDKSIPNSRFAVTLNTIAEIQSQVELSPEVVAYVKKTASNRQPKPNGS